MPTPIAPVAPQPNEYDEAIQNPRLCFSDPELRAGTVEPYPPGRGIPGLPWPRSGAFGQAYHVFSNGQQWGVKCFTRLHDDQEARYRAISAHLKQANLPCMVDFDFQPLGMRVKGKAYPLLKMAWIDGKPLDDYLEENLGQTAVLAALADKWLALVASLQAHGIAHGDLQHGNILVAGGELRLIDYDGMFVPALRGRVSHEIGHRNYQHPQRTEQQFDNSLDRFSTWVIYLSLIALREDPSLWSQFGGGDEKLLFDADDFRAPARSRLLEALSRSKKPQLRPLAAFMIEMAQAAPAQVRPLDGALVTRAMDEVRSSWIKESTQQAAARVPTGVLQPVPAAAPAGPLMAPRPAAPSNHSWLEDHRSFAKRPPKKWLPDTLWPERLGVGMQVLTSGALAYLAILGLIVPEWAALWFSSTLAMMVLLLAYRYVALPAFRERSDLLTTRASLERQRRQSVKRMRRLETQWDQEVQRAQTALTRLSSAETTLKTRQTAEQQTVDRELQSRQDGRLQRWQQQKRREALAQIRVSEQVIPGIGPLTLWRLTRAGIVTAADVDYDRVRQVQGVGDQRARELVAWRRQAEARIALTLPTMLPPDQAASLQQQATRARERIEKRYDKPLAHASQKRVAEEQRHAQERQRRVPAIEEEKRRQTDLVQRLQAVNAELTAYETLGFITFVRRLLFLRT